MLSCLSLETNWEMLCADLMYTGGEGSLAAAQFSHSHRKKQAGGFKARPACHPPCQGFVAEEPYPRSISKKKLASFENPLSKERPFHSFGSRPLSQCP